jgi:hypothetical protein
MRTTVTIDDDLHAMLEARARSERRTLREVLNDALRLAFTRERSSARYRVEVHHARLLPGIDPDRLNQLADELEDEELTGRLSR